MLSAEPDRSYRALMVDDAVLRTAMRQFVSRLGFEVQSADDGQCALDLSIRRPCRAGYRSSPCGEATA